MKEKLGKESKVWKGLGTTLPFEVINRLGVKPGDSVQFFYCDGAVVIEKA